MTKLLRQTTYWQTFDDICFYRSSQFDQSIIIIIYLSKRKKEHGDRDNAGEINAFRTDYV